MLRASMVILQLNAPWFNLSGVRLVASRIWGDRKREVAKDTDMHRHRR
jgi:hypothetical protein